MGIVKRFSTFFVLLACVVAFGFSAVSCAPSASKTGEEAANPSALNVVATTTMITDLVGEIGKDKVAVTGLMPTGIDPHSYNATAGDVAKMQGADVVVYNGLHLEGKMGEVFEDIKNIGITSICIEDAIPSDKLMLSEDGSGTPDPHIWFDVNLWRLAADHVANELGVKDPDNASFYTQNAEAYIEQLKQANAYVSYRAGELGESQRVLVTAHDAFNYFGAAYGFTVKGLMGISTESQAGAADVSELASFIADSKIKAIFVESSVSPKNIEALQEATRALGHEVAIGGELCSDSLGTAEDGADSYIGMVEYNIDTIVDALK